MCVEVLWMSTSPRAYVLQEASRGDLKRLIIGQRQCILQETHKNSTVGDADSCTLASHADSGVSREFSLHLIWLRDQLQKQQELLESLPSPSKGELAMQFQKAVKANRLVRQIVLLISKLRTCLSVQLASLRPCKFFCAVPCAYSSAPPEHILRKSTATAHRFVLLICTQSRFPLVEFIQFIALIIECIGRLMIPEIALRICWTHSLMILRTPGVMPCIPRLTETCTNARL